MQQHAVSLRERNVRPRRQESMSEDFIEKNFDPKDPRTWRYVDENFVDVLWAEENDLEKFQDYCPKCGYTSIDTEYDPGEASCRHCGANTRHQEREDPEEPEEPASDETDKEIPF